MASRFAEGDSYDTITPEEQALLDRAAQLDAEADELDARGSELDDAIKEMRGQLAQLTAEDQQVTQAYGAKTAELLSVIAQLDALGVAPEDVIALNGPFKQVG